MATRRERLAALGAVVHGEPTEPLRLLVTTAEHHDIEALLEGDYLIGRLHRFRATDVLTIEPGSSGGVLIPRDGRYLIEVLA